MAVARRAARALLVDALACGAAAWHVGLPNYGGTSRSTVRCEYNEACVLPESFTERAMTLRCRRLRARSRYSWTECEQLLRLASSASGITEQDPRPSEGDAKVDEEAVEAQTRPFPKVGDVVRNRGKWKDELSFGEIRQLQRVEPSGDWRAYVLELEDIGDEQYARRKKRKSKAEDVSTLRPVRAFYVRSVDGFKIMRDSKTGEPRYISDGYELDGFELPKVEIDAGKFAADLESYEDLKRRLVLDTATFGAVGAVVAFQISGADSAALFALGALAAVGYVILLERAADDVASGRQDAGAKLRGNVRFAAPIAVVAAVALKNYLSNPEAAKLLNLIPKNEFAAAMLGFVAPSRLPLLYRELRSSLKGDELLDILPGSVGQGRQLLKGTGSGSEVSAATAAPSVPRIVVVSGPERLGKDVLVEKLVAEDDRLAEPIWCTTRPPKAAELDGKDATFFKQVKFEDVQKRSGFLRMYEEQGESYGLRLDDLLAVGKMGKVCVVNADRQLVKTLMGTRDVVLIGVWVSLDSIEAIEERIRASLLDEGREADSPDLESDLRGLVRQAVDDIEFGIMSGVFDFTVINDSDVDESMETMRRAVAFAFT